MSFSVKKNSKNMDFVLFLLVCSLSLCFSSVTLDYLTYTSFEASAETSNGYALNELSSLTAHSDGVTLFGIMDSTNVNKPIFAFTMDDTTYSVIMNAGIDMDNADSVNTTNMDSEGIAFLTHPLTNTSYLFITTEGRRTRNTQSRIFLFFDNGTFVREYDLESQYIQTETHGTGDNKGFEGIDIDDEYKYFVYGSEQPLLQDECHTCVCFCL